MLSFVKDIGARDDRVHLEASLKRNDGIPEGYRDMLTSGILTLFSTRYLGPACRSSLAVQCQQLPLLVKIMTGVCIHLVSDNTPERR
jgi:hypothetical protein